MRKAEKISEDLRGLISEQGHVSLPVILEVIRTAQREVLLA